MEELTKMVRRITNKIIEGQPTTLEEYARIDGILIEFAKTLGESITLAQDFAKWVTESVSEFDKTLDPQGYREWNARLDDLMRRAKGYEVTEKQTSQFKPVSEMNDQELEEYADIMRSQALCELEEEDKNHEM